MPDTRTDGPRIGDRGQHLLTWIFVVVMVPTVAHDKIDDT